MLCSKLLRHSERSRLSRWVDDRFQRLEAAYGRLLDRVLRRPLMAVVPVLLFLGIAGALFTMLPTELAPAEDRSEEHTSELQSLMRISYAVFCLKKKKLKTRSLNSSHECVTHIHTSSCKNITKTCNSKTTV